MFDYVIDSSDQGQVYDVLMKPLVDKAFEGYDCTFIANGQTGSGKTYTMGFESSVSKTYTNYDDFNTKQTFLLFDSK